jgi:hypothetical protein
MADFRELTAFKRQDGEQMKLTHIRRRACLPLHFEQQETITANPDMKKLFILSMLIALAIFCSCQKQDSTAEQQLAQRKTELDVRENALAEREKAVAEREKAVANARMALSDLKLRALRDDSTGNPSASSVPAGSSPDIGQLKAERERRIQERIGQRQRRLEILQKMRALGAEAAPGPDATSPSPSPTPQ